MVILRNCEPELSQIIPEHFNICLKKCSFQDFWKVSSVAFVFKNFWERSTTKNYHPVSLPFVVNKIFGTIVYNRPVYQIEKCDLFYDF